MTAQLDAAKMSIVFEMYVSTADENYIAARWAAQNDLWVDFFWLSAHAVEKYLKAILLINGFPAKEGHELVKLYGRVEGVATSLLPAVLSQPEHLILPRAFWPEVTPLEFLARLESHGHPDNRYNTLGFNKWFSEVHLVDQLVWLCRRLVVPLNEPLVPVEGAPTNREVLEANPAYVPDFDRPLEKAKSSNQGPLKAVLLDDNYAFAPIDYPHPSRRTSWSSRTSVLYVRIIEGLETGDASYARDSYEVGDWLLANARVSNGVASQIRAAMAEGLDRHPGIDQP